MVKTLYCFFDDNGKCVYHAAETRLAFAQIRAKHALNMSSEEIAGLMVYIADNEADISHLEALAQRTSQTKRKGER